MPSCIKEKKQALVFSCDHFNECKGQYKMKIAISAQQPSADSVIDPRFGRAKFIIVFDNDQNTFAALSNEQSLQAAQGAGI
jgi:hypothetical protein